MLKKYGHTTNELEEKILALYAKGVSTRDIRENLAEMYGAEVSPTAISNITDKIRPLAHCYAIIYLDAVFVKLRREGKWRM